MKVRFLVPGNLRPRVRGFFTELSNTAAAEKILVRAWLGPSPDLLIAYGIGDPDLAAVVREHVEAGGRAVCWDVGYWGKSFRMALDGHHPKTLPAGDGSRWAARGFPLRDDFDPAGPIVLVGLGPKSRYMEREWEVDALARIRAVYPDREIRYRPKPNREYVPLPAPTYYTDRIEDVLRGASLVVCRHSNVAVDACLAGIPVVCEAGTGALLYGADLSRPHAPKPAERLEFLQRVAWLNWWTVEAPAIWRWIKHIA